MRHIVLKVILLPVNGNKREREHKSGNFCKVVDLIVKRMYFKG